MQMTSSRRGLTSPVMGPTDPYAEAHVYYGAQTDVAIGRSVHRTRTLSSVSRPLPIRKEMSLTRRLLLLVILKVLQV